MASFVSNSEMTRRAVVVLLILVAAILAGAEAFARFIVERHSKVQLLVNREHEAAQRLRPGKNGGPKELLIVGNSFAGMDLDIEVLQRRLAPVWHVQRYAVYNTWYNDWFYGLKRLLDEGSRPDAIALTLITTNLTSDTIRGDYSAYYLFQPRDIASLANDAKLDNTQAANLLFARYSRFYGLRSEIRKVVLQQLIPDLPRMFDLLHPLSGKALSSRNVLALITPRLQRLHRLTEQYGVRLVLIVPPLPHPGEFQQEMAAAAEATGIPLVMPYSCGNLPESLFLDTVHLTPAGATRFTEAVAPKLLKVLGPVSSPRRDAGSSFSRDHSEAPVIRRPISIATKGGA
jgi:hypothetical protein